MESCQGLGNVLSVGAFYMTEHWSWCKPETLQRLRDNSSSEGGPPRDSWDLTESWGVTASLWGGSAGGELSWLCKACRAAYGIWYDPAPCCCACSCHSMLQGFRGCSWYTHEGKHCNPMGYPSSTLFRYYSRDCCSKTEMNIIQLLWPSSLSCSTLVCSLGCDNFSICNRPTCLQLA